MISTEERALKAIIILKETYPKAKIALEFTTPFELLISTILSAQCTDARVNIVTKELFKIYKSPEDFANSSIDELEKAIFSTGFYKQKAKSIKNCSAFILNKYGGEVPSEFDELLKIPGVGRKTASVIVGNAFNIPAIAVDTHVKRISNLLGFVNTDDPEKIELKLKEIIPIKDWVISSHLIANLGRNVCISGKPKCSLCPICKLCPACKKL